MTKCDNTKKPKTYLDAIVKGGMGYGKLCIPHKIIDILITILFPPLYVILYQLKQTNFEIMPIITNIILTSCFYFPGFIHAFHIKSKLCRSLFDKKSTGKSWTGMEVDALDKLDKKTADLAVDVGDGTADLAVDVGDGTADLAVDVGDGTSDNWNSGTDGDNWETTFS